MKRILPRALCLLLCALTLFGCKPRDLSAAGGSSLPVPSSEVPLPEPSSAPEEPEPPARPAGDYAMVDGVLYWSEGPADAWNPDPQQSAAENLIPAAAIARRVDAPEADGDATFGRPGGILYHEAEDPDLPSNPFVLRYFEGNQYWDLFPTEPKAFLELSGDERQFVAGTDALAAALEAGDYQAVARLAQIENQAELYKGLSDTKLTVIQTVYRGSNDPYGMVLSAYLVVDVEQSTILPPGRQQLAVIFRHDPRLNYPRPEELPLSTLTVNPAAPLYEHTVSGSYVWSTVADLVTYRIDMPFERPEDLAPHLLLRVVVPYAYRRAVMEDGGSAGPLTPARVAEAAHILFGIENFSAQDPNYYDASTGNYTLRNHSAVTAGMGHAMDYYDETLNFTLDAGDRDGVHYVTVTHFLDPLQLVPGRVLEYRLEVVDDPLTGDTVGRVLSAARIR